jgi:peptidoglycan-N-acetylglucosamine deacetylase
MFYALLPTLKVPYNNPMKKFFIALLCFLSSSALAIDAATVQLTATKGTVALTFDDGPTEKYTPQILAILKKYNVKATFFMVGMNAQAHPDIVKMALADGHVIANHSMTHPNLTEITDAQLNTEVSNPQTILSNLTGKKPLCLRYPFNASNEHVDDVIRKNNMIPISVGFNAYDYKRTGVDKIVNRVVQNAVSGRVFVMHDGFDNREQTVAALPQIIEGIKKKGLGFSQICF